MIRGAWSLPANEFDEDFARRDSLSVLDYRRIDGRTIVTVPY